MGQTARQHESVSSGWAARLGLRYEPLDADGSRSLMRRLHQSGPLTVQKPFYPEGPVCHTYLLHPPGGIVGGDGLTLELGVAQGAGALLTTPAATKVYRSAGASSLSMLRRAAPSSGCRPTRFSSAAVVTACRPV